MKFTVMGVPPTVNTYWRRHGNIYFISARGKAYKQVFHRAVTGLLGNPIAGPVEVAIEWTTPDKRKRDVDNVLKPILDGMKGTVLIDDSQIDRLEINRTLGNKQSAQVVVTVREKV